MAEAPFRHLDDEELLRLYRVRIVKGRFEAPDGSTFEREIIRDIGWVGVVPLLGDDETVVVVRQYRPALDAYVLEIPAGLRDVPGEAPEATAARELSEEAGKRAERIEPLGHVHNSAGLTDEDGYVFLATGLSDVPLSAQGVEEQHMAVEKLRLSDVPGMIAAGELTDAKTIIGLLLTRERLRR